MKKIQCSECGSFLKINDDENLTFCNICGSLIEINNKKIVLENQELIKNDLETADKFIKEKQYDEAIKIFLVLDRKYISLWQAEYGIISCFNAYRKDNSNIINYYVFKDEYEEKAFEDIYANATTPITLMETIDSFYDEMVDFRNKEIDLKIQKLQDFIDSSTLTIELLKNNSKNENKKRLSLYFLLISFITLVIGAIFTFAFKDNNILKFIGFGLIVVGFTLFVIFAFKMPNKYDSEFRLEAIKTQVSKNKEAINELNKEKENINKIKNETK